MQTSKLLQLALLVGVALAGALMTSQIEARTSGDEHAADGHLGLSNAAADPDGWDLLADIGRGPSDPGSTPELGLIADGGPTTHLTAPASSPSATTSTTVSATTTEAPPPTTAPTAAPPAEGIEARGQRVLATIGYPWQDRLPGWVIRFHGGRDGAYGYTLTYEQAIDIYIRDGQTDQLLAHVIAHELGHAVDVTLNSEDDRNRWRQARDLDGVQWWPDSRASDFATGAGDFAEAFAAWQVGPASHRSELGGPPSAEQATVLAELANG